MIGLWIREMRHGASISMTQKPERGSRSGDRQERSPKEEAASER